MIKRKRVTLICFVFMLSLSAGCSSGEVSQTTSTEKTTSTTEPFREVEQQENIPTTVKKVPTIRRTTTSLPKTTIKKPTTTCSDTYKQKTGVFVQTSVTFDCLLQTENLEIYFNPISRIPIGFHTGDTDKEVVEALALLLEEAFEAFGCPATQSEPAAAVTNESLDFDCRSLEGKTTNGMGLRWPGTNAEGRIVVTLGGAQIPAQGYSRQKIIQFKPYADSSQRYSTAFVYHEVFHQFQWAYTNDDIQYLTSQDFIESMADFASAKALDKETPCLGDAACLKALKNTEGTPWGPAYDGEYWFEYLDTIESPSSSTGKLLDSILTTYDEQGKNDFDTFTTLYGPQVFDRFNQWALSDDTPTAQ